MSAKYRRKVLVEPVESRLRRIIADVCRVAHSELEEEKVSGKAASIFNVATAAEAEEAEYVVCSPATWLALFVDNRYGRCCKCKKAIQFRPYLPMKVPKICLPCLVVQLEAKEAAEDIEDLEHATAIANLKAHCEAMAKKYDPPARR